MPATFCCLPVDLNSILYIAEGVSLEMADQEKLFLLMVLGTIIKNHS